MTCIDPALSNRLFESEPKTSPAWAEHLALCRDCRVLHEWLPAALAGAVDGEHPSAEALVDFDSAPHEGDAEAARRTADHLASCEICRGALDAAAHLGLPTSRVRAQTIRPWLFAAAGWLIALVLFPWPGLRDDRPGRPAFLSSETVTLTAQRGTNVPSIAGPTDVVRLQLVLGEDVAVGDSLRVRVTTSSGEIVADGAQTVHETGEHGWPVIVLDRRAIGNGRFSIHVGTRSGLESEFALDLK